MDVLIFFLVLVVIFVVTGLVIHKFGYGVGRGMANLSCKNEKENQVIAKTDKITTNGD